MIEEIKAQYEKDGAKAVLGHLRALRRYGGDERSFWERFVVLAALLCRSPFAVILEKKGEGWEATDVRSCPAPEPVDLAGNAGSLAALAARAEQNGFAFERAASPLPGFSVPFLLVVLLDPWEETERRAVCLVADKANAQLFNEIIVRVGLIADLPRDYFARVRQAQADGSGAAGVRGDVVDAAQAVMAQPRFLTACSTLVHEVAQRFGFSRVSLGWQKRGYIRLVSVSHLEEFTGDSAGAKALEALFEEVADQEVGILFPREDDQFVVDRAHRDYCARNGLRQIASLPLHGDGRVAAVIICERQEGTLAEAQRESLSLLLEIVSPWLAELRVRDTWVGGRMAHGYRKSAARWFSGERLAGKLAVLFLAGLLVLSLVVELDYRIEGVATLNTDSVRFISAPFDGVIRDMAVREGDTVRAGNRLVSLDTRELQLKRVQEAAEVTRFTREVDKSRAQNALADMKIAQAKMEELQAELARTAYNLERATITAPSSGIVVEGDSKKLLGAPVAKGDVLMKIARVEGMYALIKVRERDIDEVHPGMPGKLVLVSRPESPFAFTVEKMIPMAEVDQREGNVFVLKAKFSDPAQAWWRPGMSGLARIEAGRRSIAWILTHRIVEFIRMYVWW
ncbi:MAG: efflux RND transporter periplasmic adaptor subunit [Pseudomonadota bacterium]